MDTNSNSETAGLTSGEPVFRQMISDVVSSIKQTPDFKAVFELSISTKGQEKIIDIKEDNSGIYKDEAGRFNFVSVVCTHLNCTPAWNNDEQSWDCSCRDAIAMPGQ